MRIDRDVAANQRTSGGSIPMLAKEVAGLARFAPTPVTQAHLSELGAAGVIAAWILVPVLAGARRTLTQDA